MTPLILIFLACQGGEPAAIEREEAVPPRMKAHYDDAVAARDAVVRGDLKAVRRHAAALTQQTPVTGTEEERALQERVTSFARTASTAPDLAVAATALGEMAQACGACHVASSAAVTTPVPARPDWAGQANEMLRHQWAADAMWLALVRPSDAELADAVSALGESPLASGAKGMDPVPDAVALEVQVHTAAAAAAAPGNEALRGARYGEVLATCAACHALAGVRPGG